MITINFLPVDDLKRRLKGRALLIGYGLALVLAAAAMLALKAVFLEPALAELKKEADQTLASLNDVSDEVARASAVTGSAIAKWKRLAAVMELEERRRDQTRLLTEVEELLPANAWLVGLSHGGGLMGLEGIAADKETVSQFLALLEKAAYIDRASITLERMSQDLTINGVRLTKFSIKARTVFPKPAILETGLPEFGLPSREDFARAVRDADDNLAAGLAGGAGAPAPEGL
ncbi:MAG: PilN domain-containing protein [Candidatus Adiutrix sp.]|jgi:Tfp pilus assembly protein PilN|nr:PilN domain-containing protein [Candidatus Adiutrix sp.]